MKKLIGALGLIMSCCAAANPPNLTSQLNASATCPSNWYCTRIVANASLPVSQYKLQISATGYVLLNGQRRNIAPYTGTVGYPNSGFWEGLNVAQFNQSHGDEYDLWLEYKGTPITGCSIQLSSSQIQPGQHQFVLSRRGNTLICSQK